MNILVLQGPNLNLVGLRSAQLGQKTTLDKINRSLRKSAAGRRMELKSLQTEKISKAIAFIQRNRNWADGIIVAPMAWGRYELALLETLSLVQLPVVQVLFNPEFGFGPTAGESVFTAHCIATVEGPPESVFVAGLDALINPSQ